MATIRTFLTPAIQENICQNLDLKSADNLRRSMRLPKLDCRYPVNDIDQGVFFIESVTNNTVELAELIEELGSNLILHNLINKKRETHLIKLLLRLGANPEGMDKYGTSALSRATILGRLDVMKLLLATGVDVDQRNSDDSTSLIKACFHSGFDEIKFLIENGANVNAVDQKLHTPLLESAYHKSFDSFKLLIDHKADIFVLDKDNKTTLIRSAAAHLDDFPKTKLLIELGVDVNKQTKNGMTALMFAASNGELETLELLLKSGVNVNLTDKTLGNTALIYALSPRFGDQEQRINLLLKYGADINHRNLFNNTALSLAIRNNNFKAIRPLQAAFEKKSNV